MSSGISLFLKGLGVAWAIVSLNSFAATTRYVSPFGNHTAPFLTWETAATNIQSAIGVTTAGDLVLVTNGVYRTGGFRTIANAQTNRVAITNAIIVRSVNGPTSTVIEGAQTPGATNGLLSIRCVYIAAGAVLDGFTLTNGTTTLNTPGGGVLCANLTSVITNCVIVGNISGSDGGGVASGTIWNSRIEGNIARGNGGGSSASSLTGCRVQGNIAGKYGGGAHGALSAHSITNTLFLRNSASSAGGVFASGGTVRNCTIVQNQAGTAGGIQGGTLINSIVYYNSAKAAPNHASLAAASFSCSLPLPAGASNISTPPRLLPDFIHLQPDSPCIAMGTPAGTSGLDIDGYPWNALPSIGCDEWTPAPLAVLPSVQAIPAEIAGDMVLSFPLAGATPICQWSKDGHLVANGDHYGAADTSRLMVKGFGPTDAGAYQVVATNAYGAITSSVMQVSVACVDVQSSAPSAPYSSWTNAATNIQDAVDVAQGTTVVLVTNGIYAVGARYVPGYGASRVVLDKAVTVVSVNGSGDTIIEGARDPVSTNGAASVRCVWMGAETFLAGFTLRNGTSTNNGGGVFTTPWSAEPQVYNCVISNCFASESGGGAYGAWLANCVIANNSAPNGGGMSTGTAESSTFEGNTAANGAGAYDSLLNFCEVIGNLGSGVYGGEIRRSLIATNVGAGISGVKAESCRIIGNAGNGAVSGMVMGSLIKGNRPFGIYNSTNLNCTIVANASAGAGKSINCLFAFNGEIGTPGSPAMCMLQPGTIFTPVNPAITNFILFPNLHTDMEHIASNSACIGRGTNHGLVPLDLDGQPFANPPAIGCDEWSPEIVIAAQPRVIPGDLPGEAVAFFDLVGEPAQCLWLKDNVPVPASEHYADVNSNSLKIRNFGPEDSGNYQVIASNRFGVATSTVVQVKVACVDPGSTSPAPPYGTWLTAAKTIQEAVDIADDQTVVVVTNGIYASGQRAVGSDTPNRLVVDKSVVLISANGAEATVIEGAWDPVSTNGAASVRCAWLSSEAMMGGFTFRNGSSLTNGGGVWVDGTGPAVNLAHCVVTTCSSAAQGGGVFRGYVQDSTILRNLAKQGGGTAGSTTERSWIRLNRAEKGGGVREGITQGSRIHENTATVEGGGAYPGAFLMVSSSIAFNSAPNYGGATGGGYGKLYHCTIVSNTAWAGRVGGADFVRVNNCIIYHNLGLYFPDYYGESFQNMGSCSIFDYVCTPYPTVWPRAVVLNDLPQLVDVTHLAATSPCIEAGLSLGNTGFTDIDGEPWRAKPSMGCDEFYAAGLVGPLSVTVAGWPKVATGGSMPLAALIDGRATGVQWNFGDGVVTNQMGFNPSYTWAAPGKYQVTATVYNNDHLEGVSASLPVEVIPFEVPQFGGEAQKAGNTFRVSFSSQPGVTYEVYSATNLVAPIDWKLLNRLTGSGPTMSLEDTNATVESRFYRLEVK